jgi:uncharacterized Zn finger protein
MHSFYLLGKTGGGDAWGCTCPSFSQRAVCKHSMGAAILAKDLTIPTDRLLSVIGTKAKACRKKRLRVIDEDA